MTESTVAGYLRVSVLTNEITFNSTDLVLRDRESELLTLLALSGGYADAITLVSSMWPDTPLEDGLALLWQTIVDLSRALHHAPILRSEKHGYRLECAVSVDIWEIGVYLRTRRPSDRARCSVESLMYRRLHEYNCTRRFHLSEWKWSRPLIAQLDGYRRTVGLALGRGLLAENRVYEAYRFTQHLSTAFPHHEGVRELAQLVESRLIDQYMLAVPKAS